jgi:hypothetical protein
MLAVTHILGPVAVVVLGCGGVRLPGLVRYRLPVRSVPSGMLLNQP